MAQYPRDLTEEDIFQAIINPNGSYDINPEDYALSEDTEYALPEGPAGASIAPARANQNQTPTQANYSSTGHKTGNTRLDFAESVMPYAQEASRRTGVPAEVLIAHAAQETGWGKHVHDNNYFNITGSYKGQSRTRGDTNAAGQKIRQGFRVYDTPQESFNDLAALIARRYPNAIGTQDALSYGTALKQRGYAEDPGYAKHIRDRAAELQKAGFSAAKSPAPQSTAPQLSSAQPAEMYDIDLPNGGKLSVPGHVSREEALAEAKANGIDLGSAGATRELTLPNGGILQVPEGVSDEEALAEARANFPELADMAAPQPEGGKGHNVFKELAGNVLGGGKEAIASLYEGIGRFSSDPSWREDAKQFRAEAEKMRTEIPQEEVDAAYKQGFGSGVLKEFQQKGLYPAADMVGRYGHLFIPGSGIVKAGQFGLEAVASTGDTLHRAEQEGKEISDFNAVAGGMVSSALATLGLPHTLSSGLISKVLGGASGKTIEKVFKAEGAEAAEKLIGSRLADVARGAVESTAAGFGVMAGTDAAQRAAIGMDTMSPEELKTTLENAAWFSFMGLPSSLGAKGRRAEHLGYLKEQEALKQKALELRGTQPPEGQEEAPPAPSQLPDEEFPDLTKAQADLLREAEGKAAEREAVQEVGDEETIPPTTEDIQETAPPVTEPPAPSVPPSDIAPPAAEAVAPEIPEPTVRDAAEVAPEVLNPADILGLNPRSGLRTQLKGLDVNNPVEHAKINEILAKTSASFSADNLVALEAKMQEVQNAQQIPQAGAAVRSGSTQPEIRQEGRDQAVGGQGVEPSGQGIKTPEVKAQEVGPFQVTELPDNRVRVTGLKNAGIDIAKAQESLLAAKAPKGQITADGLEFHKSRQGDVLAVLEGMRTPEGEVPEVKIPEAKAPEVQAEVPKAPAPEATVPEIKTPVMQAEVPEAKAPVVEAPATPTTPAKPKRVSAEKEAKESVSPQAVLAKKITALGTTLTELHGQIKAENAKPIPNRALLSQFEKRRENAEQLLATARRQQSKMLQVSEAARVQEAEAQAAATREEAARKVKEQGGYTLDLLEAEQEGRKLEKEGAARQTTPTLPVKPVKQKLKETAAPTEEDIIKRIEEMQAKKAGAKPEAKDADKPYLVESIEPTPKDELVDRAIRRLLHKEDTGEDIWVPGAGNRQVQATLRRLLTQRDTGKLTEEQLHSQLNDLLDQITIKAAEKKFKSTPRVRGADFIRQRLLEAKRKGLITDRAADMAEWFIKKNPALVEDLGISIKGETPRGDATTAGFYDKANRVFTLIAENAKDTTTTHETLHHLERMMPANIRVGIAKAWAKSLTKARDKAIKNGDETLSAFFNAALTGDHRATKRALEGLSREQLGEHYQHFSPSEFWAVNGARIIENRYNSSPAFLKRLTTWLREFGQHVKGTLGLESDAPILRAIDTMLKEKAPEYRTERLLAEETGKQEAKFFASRTPKPDTETQERKLRDLTTITPSGPIAKLSNVKDAVSEALVGVTSGKFRQAAIAQSEGLAKHLSKLETYSDYFGIRADLLRNQYDGIAHLFSHALNMGTPDISEGNMMKINKNSRLALGKWLKESDKLEVDQRTAFGVLRALIGEARAQETGDIQRKIATLTDYANRMKKAADGAEGRDRDKYRNKAAEARTKARELSKKGDVDLGGLEKLVSAENIAEAHNLLKANPKLADWVKRTHEINRAAVDFQYKTGVLDKATAADWKARPYIPLFKSLEQLAKEEGRSLQIMGGSAKSLGGRKKAKGGTQIVNVPENMLRSWIQMYTTGYTNHVRKVSVDQLRLFGGAEKTGPSDKMAVKVREGGRDTYWRVADKNLLTALEMSPFARNTFMDIISAPSSLLRAGAIKTPLFWLKSLTREPLTANFTSRTGFVSPVKVAGEVLKTLAGYNKGVDPLHQRGITGYYSSDVSPEAFTKALTKTSTAHKLGDFWNHIHTSFDTATRTAVQEEARKQGIKLGLRGEKLDDFAALRASEFANFATKGSSQLIHEFGRMTPFFNASLNSLDNLARSATGRNLNAREKAEARSLFRARAVGMAHFTMLYTLAQLNNPAYRDAANNEWLDNWMFDPNEEPGGMTRWKKIAVGFEPAFLFKTIPEVLTRMYMGALTPKEATVSLYEKGKERMLPPMVPLLPALLFEGQTGVNLVTGRATESLGMQKLPVEMRDKGASEIAKKVVADYNLGKMGISPTVLDAMGKGLAADIYSMATMMADLYLASNEGLSLYDKDMTQKYPVAKAIYTNPQNIQQTPTYFEGEAAAQQAVTGINKAANRGDVKAFERLMKDPELIADYQLSGPLRKIRENIQSIDSSIAYIENMKVSEKEKEKLFAEQIRLKHLYIKQGAEAIAGAKRSPD